MMGQLACDEGRGHTLHIIHLACTTHSPFTTPSLLPCTLPFASTTAARYDRWLRLDAGRVDVCLCLLVFLPHSEKSGPRRGLCVNTTTTTTTSISYPKLCIPLLTIASSSPSFFIHLILVLTISSSSLGQLVDMASKLQELSTKLLAADNLPAWFPVHHFNQPSYNYKTGVELVDWKQPSLWFAVGMVLFNPIFWNTVARNGEWVGNKEEGRGVGRREEISAVWAGKMLYVGMCCRREGLGTEGSYGTDGGIKREDGDMNTALETLGDGQGAKRCVSCCSATRHAPRVPCYVGRRGCDAAAALEVPSQMPHR